MIRPVRVFATAIGLAMLAVLPTTPASADLVISQLVVELKPESRTADVEVFNDSTERSFISIEPREIVAAGTDQEKSVASPDPEQLGLLVSPRRIILEPKQRRTVRIAAVGALPLKERVYRVTVKPVVGEINGDESGLKLLVGYDLLVMARPPAEPASVDVLRNGESLVFVNRGNSSVELIDGKQCPVEATGCQALPNKRLYAGASWQQPAVSGGSGEYRIRSAAGWSDLEF